MADTTVDFGYAVWGGGSGDLSADNWIIGYVENGSAFAGWVTSGPPVNANLEFETSLAIGIANDSSVGNGGTLTGTLTTTGSLNYDNTASENILSGSLTAAEGTIGGGALVVGGAGAALNLTGNSGIVLDVAVGTLTIDNDGSVSVAGPAYVGYGGVGRVTVGQAGSTLTVGGDLVVGYGTGSQGGVVITDGGSASVTGSGNGVSLGASGGSGGITLENPGSSLNAGASLTLYSGQVTINDGAVLSALDSVTIDGSGATVTVSGTGAVARLDCGGLLDVAAGLVTISDGASATATDEVSVGGGASAATVAVSGSGSTLTDGGDLFVGLISGDAGTLTVSGGATFTVGGSLVGLSNGSSISVDATSAMEIGGTGNLKTGTITVDAGEQVYLSGPGGGTISGSIDNNGTIADGSNTYVGTLTLSGPLTGSGVLNVVAVPSGGGVSDLVVSTSVGDGQTADFLGASGTLSIGDLGTFGAAITGFQQGDTVDLLGITANGGDFDASTGILTLTETASAGSTTVGTLHFDGLGSNPSFQLSADGHGGTDLTVGTTTPSPTIMAPGTATVGVGQANPIGGISIVESPTTNGEMFTVTITDTNGILSAKTSASGGGGTVTPSNGGTTLTIDGTLGQVNADLSTLTDDDASTASDTVTVDASDTNGGSATPASIAVTVNALPFIAAPASLKAQQGKATAVKGVSVSETGNTTTSGETFTVVLSDAHGVLSATIPAAGGGTVTPSNGGATLTIKGTLAQVNADLSTLTDNDAVATADTVTVSATDSFGNMAASKAIAVSVKAKTTKPAKPIITASKTATVYVGQASPVIGISLAETPLTSGETFTAVLTDVNGVLSASTAAPGGGGAVTSSNGGKTLTITGTLAQVNADLTKLTDKDGSTAAPDKITVNAHDSNGGVAALKSIAVTVNPNLGDGSFTVALTGSKNTVTIGNGNSSVSGGQNANTIAIGNGNSTVSLSGSNNSVTLGNGTDTVTLGGSGNTVKLGNGNATVSAAGGGNKISVGNGNDTITVGGKASTVTLGNGVDTVHGGTGDTINLAATTLNIYGTHEMVFFSAGSATVNDFSTGLDLKIGPTAGADVLSRFASDPSSIVDLTGGIGGFKTTASVVSALTGDGHGGTLLSLGNGGSLDFAGVTLSQIHAANFQIG
jgi:hypothetical protein